MSDTPITRRSQSGSQKRRRQHVVNITFDDTEFMQTQEKASASGLSLAGFGRAAMLGSPGPRARRRPPLNAELLAYAVAQLNRVGNNLNQLNKRLNAVQAAGAGEAAVAIAETRAAIRQICETLGRRERHDSQGQHTP
jgi:hypothetical protein